MIARAKETQQDPKARGWLRSQDPVLVQQGVDNDPKEERHDHGDEEDGLERMPGALGARLTAADADADDAAAPPDLAAAVLAGRRRVVAAGVRRRRYRRRNVRVRRSHLHLAQLRGLAGGRTQHLRHLFRRRLESRRRIHLKEVTVTRCHSRAVINKAIQ